MLSKTQQVWRHLAWCAIEEGQRRWPTLTTLASDLGIGVSTVHKALAHPAEIGAVDIRSAGGVRVVDPGRLLILWAGHRRLERDIIERYEVSDSAPIVERSVTGPTAILGGFGAVVAHLKGNLIADYETVLVYGDPALDTSRQSKDPDSSRTTEVIVVRPDPLLGNYGRVTPLVQACVDLFWLPGWQAARFFHHLLPDLTQRAGSELPPPRDAPAP